VLTTWMGDRLQTSEPSRYIINTTVNLAFYLFEVGISSTVPACLAGDKTGRVYQVANNPIWQVTLLGSAMGMHDTL